MTFVQLAEKLQKEHDGELARLRELETRINTKAAALEQQFVLHEERVGVLNAKEKQLQAREEEVSRRELAVRRDDEVQKDLADTVALHKTIEADKKAAQALRDEATMKLEDLERRELALSEREKTYKQEIELDVMKRFTFGK